MSGIGNLIGVIPALAKLSEGMGKNRDQFPVFNTEETDPEKFWNSLNKGKFFLFNGKRHYHTKTDVGGLAVHQGFMKPSMGWNGTNIKYKDLNRRQQKIIAAALKCKDELYTVLGIRALCGNLFKI
jgi:hypothetical protein